MRILIITAAVVLLAMIASVASVPELRARTIGDIPLLNALVPLAAAGLVWLATALVGYAQGIVEEGTPPKDLANVLVEDISFGFPKIDFAYQSQRLTGSRMRQFLKPFSGSGQSIAFSNEEANALNAIATRSGMLHQVIDGKDYDLKDIRNIIRPTLLYYEYTQWSPRLIEWADFLATNKDNPAAIQSLVDEHISRYIESSGIFQGIVGMADREEFSLTPIPAEVELGTRQESIGFVHSAEEGHLIVFREFGIKIADSDSLPNRIEAGKELALLLRNGCRVTLEGVFRKAADIFLREVRLIDGFVGTLNSILTSRTSTNFSLLVSISNVGRYDTFFRRQAKVIVGAPGSGVGPLELVVTVEEGEEVSGSARDTPYFVVESRDTSTIKFSAVVPDELRGRLHGAYASGLNYLKIGLIASAGTWETSVASAAAPFSVDARQAVEQKINEMKLLF